jgi:hydroxypyruvate reductase
MNALSTDASALFEAAVRRVQADRLLSDDPASWTDPPLEAYGEVRVAGMGKAAMAMAGVLEDRHPGIVDDGGVVVPAGYVESYPDRLPEPTTVRVVEGGHPLPTDGSVRGARRLLEQAAVVGEGDLLIALVSGGGTALSTLPVDEVDLADLKTVYHHLLTAGVPIGPANTVRKHLTKVGGGQLAQAAAPATVSGLAVSDVVGDDMSVIASGPTVPDTSTYEEALQVLYRHGLWHDVPAPVRDHLAAGARGRRPETPGPDDPCFDAGRTVLVGRNATALAAARAAAEERGYRVRTVTSDVEGEARTVGRRHVETMLATPVDEPTCWLWGGEPTVTVTGDGTGGRNQEVALGAALALEGASQNAILLSGGTDGIDGPTDAAGAWALPDTAARARAAGCDPEQHLDTNNAYPLFDALDQLIRTGPTHTNVMDVHVGLVRPC